MRFLKKLRALSLLVFTLGSLELPLEAQVEVQTFRIESFQGQDVVAGEILVRFRAATGIQVQALAAQDTDIAAADAVGRSGAVRLRSRNRNVAALLQAYRNRLDVLYAEPNYVWHASDVPNDALFGQQWGLRNTGQVIDGVTGTSGADIRAAQAWDITEGSRGIVVGVVDSGVDYNHPDLAANVWSAPSAFTVNIGGQVITCAAGTHGFNAITRTCDPMDDLGHGTHVSGIIGGTGNNGAGISGVSRVGSIMGLKFISGAGSGTTVNAIAAIEFAIQVKALFPTTANIRVLNNSWGGTYNSLALRDEISLTLAADMLLVASAGNSARTNDLVPDYPASYDLPNIVSVAATDNADALASFSNWGTTTVHLGAPGNDVLSSLLSGTYGLQNGTSMAAPMVSGAAALVLSACSLTTSQLRSNLLNNVDPLTSVAGKTTSGGRLNVYRSLTGCAGAPQPGFRVSVTPGTQTTEVNGSVNLTVTVTPVNGFTGAVSLAATGLPAGVAAAFNPSSIAGGSGTSTLTLTTGPTAQSGTAFITVTGTSGAQTSTSGVALTVGATIASGQTISGALTTSDQVSPQQTKRYADFYRVTLSSTAAVTIDLKSRVFDTFLYVLSTSGTTLYSSDNEGGGGDSQISTTLAAGTYSIEVSSVNDSAVGGYFLSVNAPTLSTMSPAVGEPGSSFSVTLGGTRLTSPLTVNAGTGITVTDISVSSSTQATATFTIAANAALSSRDVTITTAEGTSDALAFAIPSTIAVGQRISGTLAITDQISPNAPYSYADLYRLTLTATTAVTIDLRSTAFTSAAYVLSSAGAILYTDTFSGGNSNARITATLDPGTYYVEASSLLERKVGDYTLSVNLPVLSSVSPRFRSAGTTYTATLTGNNFSSPMTVDGGADVTVGNASIISPTSASATFTIGNSATPGNRDVTVTTSAGVSNTAVVRVVPAIFLINPGGSATEELSNTDLPSLEFPGSYQDLYQLTLASTTTVTMNLTSTAFDAYLLVLSSSGIPQFGNDNSGGNGNPRITTTFPAGTYFLEVTSVEPGDAGAYTLTVGQVALTSVTPRFGGSDTPVNVTFIGAGLSLPMTVDAGAGIAVTNIALLSPTSATATLTIAPGAAIGARSITVTTIEGTSNPVTFTVFAPIADISPGQTVNGTLSTTDPAAPGNTTVYGDMYRLTLASSTTVSVGLSSTAFDSYLQIIPAIPGTTLSDNDSGGNRNARIQTTLNAGTYFVLATSLISGLGDYSLTLGSPPTLTASAPNSGAVGTTVGVTLTGTGFLSPMTVSAGSGITVSNVSVQSSTSAIATLTIAANATVSSGSVTATTSYGTTGSIAFDVVAPQALPLSFPRLFSPSELGGTGFAIVNPTSVDASVTFTLYSAAGAVLGTSPETVPARGQFSRLGNELFPGATQSGWIRATSSTVGLQSFWVGGNFTSYMDGAAAAPVTLGLVFPLVTPQTEINIVNAGTAANTVTLRVQGASGTELAPAVTQNIPTDGIYSANAATLFPSVDFTSNTATIRAAGTLNIAGTSVTIDYPVAPSWTVINGTDASLSLFEIGFPHVPSGPMDGSPAWLSILGITNISTSAQTATITFTHNTGTTTQVTRTIAGSGTLRESVHTLFGFSTAYQEGWIKVTGTAALNGFIAYGYTETSGSAVVPAQGVPQTTLLFSHVANGPVWGTGLALLNATTTAANVQVYVMRRTGALVGGADNLPTASFTLPAGTKVAKLINELVPAALDDDGFVFVRTTNNVPLYGTELFFSRDLKVIANVAAGVLDPSITYTPPAP